MSEQNAGNLIGYGRKGGDEDIEIQIDALRAHGVPQENIYTDPSGVEGEKVEKKSGLTAALKRLKPGDVMTVWKLDRLAHSVPDIVRTVDRIRKIGADIRVLSQHIDTTKDEGKFVFDVFSVLAETERESFSRRTKEGISAAKRRGKKSGRRSVMTEEKRKTAKKMLDSGCHVPEVAEKIGIGVSTVYKHLDAILSDPFEKTIADKTNKEKME